VNIERDIENGACCAECTTHYLLAHGYRVVCGFCAARIGAISMFVRGLVLATNREKP